ncbi:MAG: hypothetical protein JSS34_06985 [Proteobacteria bacterium]|nr:hypothetical protein [Pseudomonadota bacterium]
MLIFDTLIVNAKNLSEFDEGEKLLKWKKIEKIVEDVYNALEDQTS